MASSGLLQAHLFYQILATLCVYCPSIILERKFKLKEWFGKEGILFKLKKWNQCLSIL